MMNIFRLVGDLMHLASIFILLLKIQKTKSCSGISKKTQVLYTVVFVCRYLDLFTHFVSVYNTLMKIFFIASSAYILYLMYIYRQTYEEQSDLCEYWWILVPSAVLAIIFPDKYTIMEVIWSFSIYLESLAILPQLMMMQKTGEAETITTHYLFALGSYRAFYILNWIYRLAYEPKYWDPVSWIAGIIQTLLYADFFYIYFTRVLKGKKFVLPA